MILELTGLSGAGKTTCESYLISGLKQRGFRVVLRPELLKSYIEKNVCSSYEDHRMFRILSHRWVRFASLRTLIGTGLPWRIFLEGLAKGHLKSFLWLGEDILLSTYFLQEFQPSTEEAVVYIPQEGFVHHDAYSRLWAGSDFHGLSQKLAQKFPADQIIIIYLKISADEAADRLQKRGLPTSWPKSIDSESRIKEFLLRFNETIEDGVAKFQAGGVKVLLVDSSLDLKRVESRIGVLLDSFPENRKTTGADKPENYEEMSKIQPGLKSD